MGDKLLKTTTGHGDTSDQRTQGLASTAPRVWYELGPGASVQNPYDIPLYWLVNDGIIILAYEKIPI